MSPGQGAEESRVAYVFPSASVDISRTQSSFTASLGTQRCSRVRRPRTALKSNWVDGGEPLCTCRVVRSERPDSGLLPIHCLAGDGSGPKDSTEERQVKTEERGAKSDSWFSGFKVFFKDKEEASERDMLSENGLSEKDNDAERTGLNANISDDRASSDSSGRMGSELHTGDSSRGSFRWPWQKNNSNEASLLKGKGTEGQGGEVGIRNPGSPRKKKVTHTDSKPGGSFTSSSDEKSDEETGKSAKGSSPWQDTWEKVIKVIAPNMPNLGSKKKPKMNITDEEGASKASSNGTHGKSTDIDSSTLTSSSSIRELYSPPSEDSAEAKSEPSSEPQRGLKWPKLPWIRDESTPKDDKSVSAATRDSVSYSKRSVGPRISTVEDVEKSKEESVKRPSLTKASVREERERQRRSPSSTTKGGSQSTVADEDNIDPQAPETQTEDQRENEPALQLPAVRSSQLKLSHIDMASIPQRDVAAIRLIFGSETFFATETLSPPGGLIFRGNLRGEPKATVAKLEERLAARLGDKYTLCLAEGEEDLRPVVVIVPTARDKRPATPRQRFFAVVIGILTVTTCLARGLYAAAFKPLVESFYPVTSTSVIEKFFSLQSAVSITTAASIGIIILISQIVQRVVASRYRTRIALPYFIPSFQLGSFGAVVQLASPTPTRAALFDIALSGAATLVLISLSLLLVGLRLSTTFSTVVPVPISTASSSMVIGFLTQKIPHGNILVDYGRSLIALHPLAVIGANCLTIAALNLLPMRQLDGGRIISALYGRRTAVFASRVTVMFLLLASTKNPYFVVFLAAVTFGPWNVDRPSKNELTEPDGVRTIVGYLFMLLMIGVLLPYPAAKFFGTL